MQNKGLVITLAVLLALASAFYLSFSVVTNHYDNKAAEYAQGDDAKEYQYLDSIAGEKVWFGYTLKECREKEINLGLDLKGGMNVTMEVSVSDIIRALSGYNTTENFNQAIAMAQQKQKTSGEDFLTLFFESFYELDPNAQLASVFSTFELRDKVSLTSTNQEVEKVVREEVQGAIDNSFNVLRTRIDRFGVVQPNIQKLSQTGRILIELPGIKEPERVRKLLQGSANLEFWETYDLAEILPQLSQINNEFAAQNASTEAAQTEAAPVKEEAKAEADEFSDYASFYNALIGMNLYDKDNKKANTVFKGFLHKPDDSQILNEGAYATLLETARTKNYAGLSTPSYAKINEGDKWYSEDTTVLVVREYISNFEVPSISISDKLPMTITGTNELNTPANKNQFFSALGKGYLYLNYTLNLPVSSKANISGNVKAEFTYTSFPGDIIDTENYSKTGDNSKLDATKKFGEQGTNYLVPNVSITDTTRMN